ncbi:putative disease resistance RPP8-like protein 2 [Folsomia candida]|uniref:Putative disease resistance RPP8-like protein 2 n=1 Tax=Folsomia candida TaxID=158441 RepID=A0A226DB95_FOLCA|nr:putative disease resistance RPP8-like protein 2 [Folsomia candida]
MASSRILENIINENHEALIKALDVSESLLSYLERKKIINDETVDSLGKTNGKENKAVKLLKNLRDCRTDKDIEEIKRALDDSCNSKALEIFDQYMADLDDERKQIQTNQEEIQFLPVPKPDKDFTGRTKFMSEIIKSLTSWSTENSSHQIGFPFVDIHGLGGHGKTQTAQKIALICAEQKLFSGVIWIDAEQQSGIIDKITRELKNQGIKDLSENDGILLANKLYELLISKNPHKFLVIFDNVESFEEIKKYLPLNKDLNNVAVLLTSVEKILIQDEMGEVKTFRVDILEEAEAEELFRKILQDKVYCEPDELSHLVSESGRIPVIIRVMAGTIASVCNHRGSAYKITQYLQEMKDKSSLHLRYPNDPNTKDDLNLQYKKSLYVCVKISLEKLQKSNHEYATLAMHFIERCAYFSHECDLDYFLDHVTTIKQDIKEISRKALVRLEPQEMLENASHLLSSLSLVNVRPYEFRFSNYKIKVEIHRLIHSTLRLIQEDEKRDHAIIKELIVCEDFPNHKFSTDVNLRGYNFLRDKFFDSTPIAILWSHAANHADLVRGGATALHIWASMANILATRIVSKCPELIYEKDHGGKFPFMIAAEYVNLNGLNFLLDNMEDPNSHINCPDKHGNTALILAIKDAYRGPISEVIQVLVKHGADIHYINPNTLENAWHYAISGSKLEKPELLFSQDNTWDYAFSWSNVRKSELLFPLLKILLEYEVSPDLLDNKGRTFFHSILISDNLHMLKPYITQFLEFFVSNNLERIFYCKNGEGLTVVELAEKLKIYESSDGDSLLDVRIPLDEKRVIAEPDNIHECNVSNPDELDISGSVSSSDDEYWQDRRDLLDIIIDFIKKLKSNELNVQ